jgi:hypothetical protein
MSRHAGTVSPGEGCDEDEEQPARSRAARACAIMRARKTALEAIHRLIEEEVDRDD